MWAATWICTPAVTRGGHLAARRRLVTDSQFAFDADLAAGLDVLGDGFGGSSPGDDWDPFDVVVGAVDGDGDLADCGAAVGVAQLGLATESSDEGDVVGSTSTARTD